MLYTQDRVVDCEICIVKYREMMSQLMLSKLYINTWEATRQ